MSDKPLELLPWGRTAEDQAKLDRKKLQGRRGWQGCLLYLVAFALFAAYVAGWTNGRHYQPNVNESGLDPNQQQTEQPK